MTRISERGVGALGAIRLVCLVGLVVPVGAASSSSAAAEISFQWRVPDKLSGTGVATAAKDVEDAARPPATIIELRRCGEGGTWKLDDEEVRPTATGRRCTFRLDLQDNERHELTVTDGPRTFTEEVVASDLLIVSIGDSVASGEGNPDGPSLFDPKWLDRRCHRSMRSGAARAALSLEAGTPQNAVTFLPLGCSGATVQAGLLHPFEGIQPDPERGNLPAQMAEVAALLSRREIDALILSIGANDVYFEPLVQFCAAVGNCPRRRFDPDHPLREAPRGTDTAEAVHAAAQRELPSQYDKLAEALRAAGIEADRVIITEYFDPTRDENGETCPHVVPRVDRDEVEWAQSTVFYPLNDELRKAASRHDWRLVGGVQRAFERHGICARRDKRWVVQWPESIRRGARLTGTLHPNEAGHLATAALIGPVLASTLEVEAGTAAAETAGALDGNGDSGIRWLQVLAGGVAGALLGALLVLLMQWLRRRLASRRA